MMSMMFSFLVICLTVFGAAYEEGGWLWKACYSPGCNIRFDLAAGGVVEVMATDFDQDHEHIIVYVDDQEYGQCNPDAAGNHDLWKECAVPKGSISLKASNSVDIYKYTDEAKGIDNANFVVRIPTNLINDLSTIELLSESVYEMQQQMASMQREIELLVQTNLEQAQEIQALKTATTGVITRSESDNRYAYKSHTHDERYFTESESNSRFAYKSHTHDDRYYTESQSDARYIRPSSFSVTEYGAYSSHCWYDTGLSTSNSFCALSENAHRGNMDTWNGCWLQNNYNSSGTWQVWVGEASGASQECRVYCLRW